MPWPCWSAWQRSGIATSSFRSPLRYRCHSSGRAIALSPTQADRVGKLIPLLASNVAGEVVAAAAPLQRILATAGQDLNDLADSITRPAADDWLAMARQCAARGDALNAREREFVQDMARRVVFPTEKQLAWLHAIHTRLSS